MKAESLEPLQIHRPLIPIAVTVMAGIGWGAWMPGLAAWMLWGTGLSLLAVVGCIVGQRGALVLPLLFCLMAGYFSIQPWLYPDLPQNHISRYAGQGRWRISGKIVGVPLQNSGRRQWVLAATHLTRPGKNIRVCGRVKVSARGNLAPMYRGDLVSFAGRLREIRNFVNPGGFDYRRFMAFKAIRVRSYARTGSIKIQASRGIGHWLRPIDKMRTGLSLRMDGCLGHFSNDTRTLLKVLLVGDRHQMTQRLRDQFNRAGVGHVLAISGLHIGMVATMVFFILRWILALIPRVRMRAWTRRGAAVGSLAAVGFYGVLAGLSPSTQRAMIMVAVFMAGYWVGRPHDWLNSLALAALVILVVYPPSLLSISFQLSFAAVLALIWGLGEKGPGSSNQTIGIWRRLSARVADMLRVSLLAILGTMPLVLYYFNQSSTTGLITNLVVVPAVGILVVPAGLMGVAWSFLDAGIAALCWQAAAWGMQWVLWLVEQVAQWPWSAVKIVTPSGSEIILYYLSLGLVLSWRRLPKKGLALALLLSLWLTDGWYWYDQRFGRRNVELTVLDVGQGSANLLQLPGGFTALVDGGGFSDNRYFDVGGRIIAPLLWRNKIKTVDLVVLTHPNSDHLNGLLYILEHFKVHTVWSNGEPASTWGYRQWKNTIARKGIDAPYFEQLPTRTEIQGVQFELLGPPKGFMRMQKFQKWRDHNNNSVVLALEYKGVRILLTGDIASPVEADLLKRHDPQQLRSSILMAPHHGSGKSGTLDFLKAVKPSETIISSGWENRFGFPHPHLMHRLGVVGSRVWNTADHGAVQVVIDEHGYQIRIWRR